MILRHALLILCLGLTCTAHAQSPLQNLLDAGQLTIDTAVTPQTLVPGQRASLQITIATSTWFTGGARIRLPEVPGLVILQTEEFANNASERRNGQTWVIQRWTIDVYPQRAGDFSVGPVEVSLKVNGGDLGNVSGVAQAPAVSFSVMLPAELAQAPFWVAAPEYSVRQSIDREVDALQPGEAFERRLEFRASDVQAMMLPDVSPAEIPGLASYPASPVLENRMNRGHASASRVQSISYVAEQPGSYLLPAEDFFWWDTSTGTLEVISVPAVEVTVVGEVAATPAASGAHRQAQLMGLAGIAALVLVAAALLRYRPWRALATPLKGFSDALAALRRPGLPPSLNPQVSRGNNAAD